MASRKLKAGVAKVNITPPVGVFLGGYGARDGCSQGVHDDLYAKALVLTDGVETIAICSTDLLYLGDGSVKAIRRVVEEETGVHGGSLMISCTHTHSGPDVLGLFGPLDEPYLKVLERQIAGAVYMAFCRMEEARVGFGRGYVDGIIVNRRRPLKGVVDPEIGVIRIDDLEGNMIALLVNYACHAVVLGHKNLLISADYPSYVESFIERVKGMDVVTLFTNGACGDINPLTLDTVAERVYDRSGGTFKEAERIGFIIAAEAIKTAEQIQTSAKAKVSFTSESVSLPLRPLPSLEEARRSVEDKERMIDEFRGRGASLTEVLNMKMELLSFKGIMEVLRRGREGVVATEVQSLAVNDAILIGFPGELFVEIGLEVKRRSRFKHTFIVGYANDYIGYIPTRKAFEEGGYEVTAPWCRLTPEAEDIMKEVALKTMERLFHVNP